VNVSAVAGGLWPGGWNEEKLGAGDAGVLDCVGGWNVKLGSCGGAPLEGGNRDGIEGLPNGNSSKTPVADF
jgi:hypothetical protein